MSVQKITIDKVVFVDGNVAFMIVVTNTGDCNLTGVKVTEIYDSTELDLVGFVDQSGRWSNSSDVFTYDGNLTPGSSANFTVVFKALVNGTLLNQVNVTSNETDNKTGNNTTTVYKPNMSVQKITIDKVVLIEGNVSFMIVVTNTGDCNLTNVKVTEIYNSNELSFIDYDNKDKWTKSGDVFTYGENLTAGSSANFTVVFKALVNGTLLNQVNASSNETDNKTGNNTTDVGSLCDLVIYKDVNVTSIDLYGLVEWTITVINNGPNTAEDVYVIDTLPEGLELVNLPSNCSYVQDGLRWDIGELLANKNVTLKLITKAQTIGNKTNIAVVHTTTNETDKTNNEANNTTFVSSSCDLVVSKTVNASSVYINEVVEWNITVVNNGPYSAMDVVVKDNIPAGLKVIGATPSVGQFDIKTGIWRIGDMENNTSVFLVLVTQVLTEGSITNIVVVNTTTPETNVTNNEANNTTVVNPICDLEISKIVNLKEVYVGENVIWTIKVKNNGPSTAYDIKVEDQLPKALKAISYKVTKGSFNMNSCVWTIKSLGKGASAILTLTTKIVGEGIITNPVSVNTTTEESDYTNNKANDSTKSLPIVDLELKKYSDKIKYTKGDKMHWTIVVTNNGPSTAKDVVVSDVLPSGIKFISFKASKGSYDVSTGKWNIGELENGETVFIEIYCKVINPGSITNYARVTTSIKDSDPTNDRDSSSILVNDIPDEPVEPDEPVHPDSPKVTMHSTGNPLAYLLVAICILLGSFWSRNRKE
jgi:uncharacterized repeat protein (TIGR01451 family)